MTGGSWGVGAASVGAGGAGAVADRRSGTLHGVARYALAPDNARRLWTLSQDLLTHIG
ncbi:hypothetical protein [Streptomyces sp. NEAU-YJ-81]|uniref:hypothetical protein n=1 Tax=Streptomyces sp. NEAU-YJ-81 TaxID=2820288 RepID=UPI0027E0628B|nr:hypothetical protein [Streptomyces sp. NEAU-YJ-81]